MMKQYTLAALLLAVAISLSAFADSSHSTVVADKRMALMEVLNGSVVHQALQRADDMHRNLTKEQIQRADQQWRQSPFGNPLSDKIESSACSKALIAFQKEHKSFAEIFITDAKGLNVCQTNHTSDYYQADESWWQQAYDAGKGRDYIGKVAFDKSADVTVIPIYVAIKDKNKKVIGVCKALISLY